MISLRRSTKRVIFWVLCCGILAPTILNAQADGVSNQRSFPQSKAAVENALKSMQASLSGRLPVLEGFATSGAHPLDRYQRGFYQADVKVNATPSGASQVRIDVKLTAWYADPASSKSGYELLQSNGRLETDLLDQLAGQLAVEAAKKGSPAASPKTSTAPAKSSNEESSIPAPVPKSSEIGGAFSPSLSEGLAKGRSPDQPKDEDNALQREAKSLEDILKNQAHPTNLVAVKKSGTPVVATPSLTAKPEFLASMHDEFELLDYNADWVHVRISGLSRGWIWRTSAEMPDGIADTDVLPASSLTAAADLFKILREEMAPFPGDWEPLRGKNVKIISVQKVNENATVDGPKQRLEYAKSLLEKNYAAIIQQKKPLAGIVVIFDSADGGMIATPISVLQQWKAGALSDSALWHKSFFDPPEVFDDTTPSGMR